MATLFTSITMAQQALQQQQTGLEITQKNIANVNTPGYSRQRLAVTPGDPSVIWPGVSLFGVGVGVIESFRNRFLDYRVNEEIQGQGRHEALSTALSQVEAVLDPAGEQSLDSALSQFFNSFSLLANTPEDASLRAQVLSSGNELSDRLRTVWDRLQALRTDQEHAVTDAVREINDLTAAFAAVNARAAQAFSLHSSDASELVDQRQAILDKLSGLIDISYYETETGALTVTARQGGALVLEDQSYRLDVVQSGTDGSVQIQLNGSDITSGIRQGKLGGLLSAREAISGYLTTLDDLAAGVIRRVNEQHAQGADVTGAPGGDFFVPFAAPAPGSNFGAAHSMSVAISDPGLIAAAAPGAGPGSNFNARALAAIADEDLFSSGRATAIEFYSELVYRLGSDARAAQDGLQTQRDLLLQLQNQRDSFSGVSLDEEAINLMQYQKAYEATARYIAVMDAVTEDLIRILGG